MTEDDYSLFAPIGRVITHGETENGEQLPVLLWESKPDRALVDAVYRDMFPGEVIYWKMVETFYIINTSMKAPDGPTSL
jgi:hypothetical protein